MDNSLAMVVVAVVVALVVIGAAAWIYMQKRRTDRLRSRFGPEYERVVEGGPDRRRAESVLEERQKRIEKLDIQPLSNEDQRRFEHVWAREQAHFVDDPRGAVAEADLLIADVMRTRGYPIGEFEQRAADISVDHPMVVRNYRIAHEIAIRDSRGEVGTEDLRTALLHYRALFEELLDNRAVAAREGRR